jgi:hypothetical protein
VFVNYLESPIVKKPSVPVDKINFQSLQLGSQIINEAQRNHPLRRHPII